MIVTIAIVNADIEVRVDTIFLKKFSKKLFGRYLKTSKTFENKSQINQWLCEVELKVASKYAYRLLSYKSYSSHILLKKLTDGGIRQSIAEIKVKELAKLGYINDDAYIDYLIKREIEKGYGPRYIRLKLQSMRFCGEAIETKLQKLGCEDVQKSQVEKIYRKLKKIKNEKQIYQHLIRRGFDSCIILKIINWQEK